MRLSAYHVVFALAVVLSLGTGPAWSWGCEGHETIALIAQKHLTPHARRMVTELLDASPIDSHLERACHPHGLPTIADVSTWADDVRHDDTSPFYGTGHWHFIDIPRGSTGGDLRRFCSHGAGCVISAINEQLAALRTSATTHRRPAEALMLVIHLVGDLHQPLHCATNNDAGGNCVPVTYFGDAPHRAADTYRPNLHAVWDTQIIRRIVGHQNSGWFAARLEQRFQSKFPAWQREQVDLDRWAWESHAAAERTAYGALPTTIPVERHTRDADCRSVSAPMLKLHERLGEQYQDAAAPVVEEQLAKAGIRLAMLLNQLWP